MGKKFSFWSDKAIDDKAQQDVKDGAFDQPAGWIGKTLPGNYDYDRYKEAYDEHEKYQDSKK